MQRVTMFTTGLRDVNDARNANARMLTLCLGFVHDIGRSTVIHGWFLRKIAGTDREKWHGGLEIHHRQHDRREHADSREPQELRRPPVEASPECIAAGCELGPLARPRFTIRSGSCGERECQEVYIAEVGVYFENKN